MSRITQAQFSMQMSFLSAYVSNWAAGFLVLPEHYDNPVRDEPARRFFAEMRDRLDTLEHWCEEPIDSSTTIPQKSPK